MKLTQEPDAAGQRAAVAELVSDIDAELRLHAARIQEFLDGTNEFGAVTDMLARAQLLRFLQTLSGALSEIDDLTQSSITSSSAGAAGSV